MRKIQTLHYIMGAFVVFAATGCTTQQTTPITPTNPYLTASEIESNASIHEGLVMETIAISQLRDNIEYSQAGEPWWASRNNENLSYRLGATERPYEQGVIYTYDRQQSHGSRIYNHFSRTRRSVRHSR